MRNRFPTIGPAIWTGRLSFLFFRPETAFPETSFSRLGPPPGRQSRGTVSWGRRPSTPSHYLWVDLPRFQGRRQRLLPSAGPIRLRCPPRGGPVAWRRLNRPNISCFFPHVFDGPRAGLSAWAPLRGLYCRAVDLRSDADPGPFCPVLFPSPAPRGAQRLREKRQEKDKAPRVSVKKRRGARK